MATQAQDLKLTDEIERQLAHRYQPEGGHEPGPASVQRWLPVLVAVAVSFTTAAIVF